MTELLPAMTQKEIMLLTSFYHSARSYVEFGCGGSTFFAAKMVKEQIITVDSDYTWLSKVEVACRVANTKLHPRACFVDIGPTKEFGYPVDEARREAWPMYHEQVWSIADASAADLYMIDGRFRLACFLQTLLHAQPEAVILIHDYVTRPHYHFVEQFTRELCRTDELVAFQRSANFSREKATAMLLHHRFDTR